MKDGSLDSLMGPGFIVVFVIIHRCKLQVVLLCFLVTFFSAVFQ